MRVGHVSKLVYSKYISKFGDVLSEVYQLCTDLQALKLSSSMPGRMDKNYCSGRRGIGNCAAGYKPRHSVGN